MRANLTIALFSSLGIALASSAYAANQGEQSPSQAVQESQQHAFSDQELNRFISVQSQLFTIQQEYKKKLNQAQKPAQKEKIQAEAQNKMRQAIQDEGLTVKRYTEIKSSAREDPALKKELKERLRESR